MNTNSEKKMSLREQVLRALTGSDSECQEVISQIAVHSENERPNDLVYAILLELELLHRSVEQIYIRSSEQHKVIGDNLIACLDEKNRCMSEFIVQQQFIFRSQFRRLIAIHRERFMIRLLLFSAMLFVTVLAGIGVFYIYVLIFL